MSLHAGASLGARLPSSEWRTRFAPAPTGYLHLGHLVNAIHVWGIAGAFGGRVLLRIEDHDLTRCRAEYERGLLDDLEWLGFAPDIGAVEEFRAGAHPQRQSDNGAAYARALHALETGDHIYPCDCSRRDIQAAAGLVEEGMETPYPGTCAARMLPADATRARRVRLDARQVAFDDLRLGPQVQQPSVECGDVLVRDRFGHWTYQFAVTVDDRDQGIDVIIRGEDLLRSTGRQLQIGELLGRREWPLLLHHPLLLRSDGRKLSKAAHDTSLRELRAQGASAASLIGDAAWRCGLLASPRDVRASEVAALFA